MAAIRFSQVSKRFDNGQFAVKALDLDIADGEFLVLVGPSGCGKSTALRMIAGLEAISAGEIHIGGGIANDLSPRQRNVAMIFQSYALYPHLSVRENLSFALRMRKEPRDAITARVAQSAAMLELGALLARRPGQLSGGQRQRVAMGRALVRHPQAFLMDEPLSNLDARLRGQMRVEIARLQRLAGVTTIYVTHDQVEAMTMADRVAVMRDGVLQQLGRPRDLYDDPVNLFVAAFIGSPPINLLRGALRRGADGAEIELVGRRFPLPHSLLQRRPGLAAFLDSDVIVGVRPEDARLGGGDGATLPGIAAFQEDLGPNMLTSVDLAAGRSEVVLEELGEADIPRPADRLRINSQSGPRLARDEPIEATLDLARLHLFDPQTKRAIR